MRTTPPKVLTGQSESRGWPSDAFIFSDDIQDWIEPMKQKSYYKKSEKRKYSRKQKTE